MQITLFTDYGLRTLMWLANHSDRMNSVREIAEHHNISYNHLTKVARRLVELGYIHSVKGKGGGLTLATDITTLRLGDLVLALEANMHIAECFDPETNTCRLTQDCRLKHFLYEASDAFVASLNKYTLADCLLTRRSPVSS